MPPADPHRQTPVRVGRDDALVDLGRSDRCGLPEAIYGDGKSADLIAKIGRRQIDAGQNVLVTRLSLDVQSTLTAAFPDGVGDITARTFRIMANHDDPQPEPHVALVTAGSTDAPVAAEAAETLRWAGVAFEEFRDIGVAGPQRLLTRIDDIRRAAVVIVVAGMEGALPSVVAGHVAVPVIAVPTSVGYGANLSGITPLLSALASCAPGVVTVGIDAGFKAGYGAALMMRATRRPS